MVNERYQVYWPWREENPDLQDNYNLAYRRLKSALKRLRENPETLKMYENVIKDQWKKGIIESVDDNSIREKLSIIFHTML